MVVVQVNHEYAIETAFFLVAMYDSSSTGAAFNGHVHESVEVEV